ncbi:hypothetical protein ASD99_12080 [Mesorhizobium sp. Root695]|nr:hypothetical protein ASD99_12080 [Mesorhizobium sp. Root695]
MPWVANVYRTTLRLSEDVDVEKQIAVLRRDSSRAGLSELVIEEMTDQVRVVVGMAAAQGTKLTAQGSQMSLSRQIRGEGYELQLIYGAGAQTSWLGRFVRALKG